MLRPRDCTQYYAPAQMSFHTMEMGICICTSVHMHALKNKVHLNVEINFVHRALQIRVNKYSAFLVSDLDAKGA